MSKAFMRIKKGLSPIQKPDLHEANQNNRLGFFIVSIVIVSIFPLVNIFLIYVPFLHLPQKNAINHAIRVVDHLKAIHLVKFTNSRLDIRELALNYQKLSKTNLTLAKLKVFSREGKVIFSSQSQEINITTGNPDFYKVVAKGKVFSKTIEQTKISKMDVVETLVPIMTDGNFLGAIEVGVDITEELEKIKHLIIYSTMILVMALLLILTTIFIILSNENKAKKALKINEKRFQALIENSSNVFAIIDPELKILYTSPSTKKLLGYEPEEVIGKNILEFVHPDDLLKIMELAEDLLQKPDSSTSKELRYGHKNGSWRYLEVIATNLLDDPSVSGIVATSRDITEHKLAQEELLKKQDELFKVQKFESIGLLAGGIAHDFNNILTSILANIQLSKMLLQKGKDISKYLDSTEEAIAKASALTKQLLTFSKGEAPIKRAASIPELISDTVDFTLRGSNVTAELLIDNNLWPVEIDEDQISQVINNLIINAVQAMPDGGIIKVLVNNASIGPDENSTTRPGKYVRISVADEGLGIPEENLPKIFDPYFTTKQKGYGLGLATSFSIINRHNGYLRVESKVGAGSLFHILLPASDHNIVEKEMRSNILFAGKGKLLLMDDQSLIRDLTGQMLTQIGYEVVSAKDGNEMIKRYQEANEKGNPFDAVILDLTVPGGMGGKKAINKLKEINPQVKAIVSSGYSNDPVMADYEKYGFCGVVSKPYKIEELGEVLHKLINKE